MSVILFNAISAHCLALINKLLCQNKFNFYSSLLTHICLTEGRYHGIIIVYKHWIVYKPLNFRIYNDKLLKWYNTDSWVTQWQKHVQSFHSSQRYRAFIVDYEPFLHPFLSLCALFPHLYCSVLFVLWNFSSFKITIALLLSPAYTVIKSNVPICFLK